MAQYLPLGQTPAEHGMYGPHVEQTLAGKRTFVEQVLVHL